MHTASVTSPVGPDTNLAATSPALTSVEQEITNTRSHLEQLEDRKTAILREETERLKRDIAQIPGFLKVSNLREAYNLIGNALRAQGSTTTKLHDATLLTMRDMFVHKATSKAIATALKLGISTVDKYKAKWGFTHGRNGNVEAMPATQRILRRRSSKRSHNGHLTPEKKARIVAALQQPDARVSVIARRFRVSRQSCYTIRAEMERAAFPQGASAPAPV